MSATIASFRSTVDNPALMRGIASRQALKDYLDLLASAHPVKQCVITCASHATTLKCAQVIGRLECISHQQHPVLQSNSSICNQVWQNN